MPDVSLASLALRLAISMGVVIALMVVAAKLLRRAQSYASGIAADGTATPGADRRSRRKVVRTPITIGGITPLTRGASVAIVRAAGRELVLGVTDHQITLLHAGFEPVDTTADGFDPIDLAQLDLPSPTPGAARIAAPLPHSTSALAPVGGTSAWTDALETLRARTVRR